MEHRALGYQQAILEAGLRVEEDFICKVKGYPTVELEPLIHFLTRHKQLSAVFAANDQIALAVYQAARQAELSIPQDIALVGFDNLDFTDHLDVPLTTVAQPAFEIGQTAFEILFRRICHQLEEFQQVILPTKLVVRQSCGYSLHHEH
jgi:DNA-binding LacI/PurR family transcriptional regulator